MNKERPLRTCKKCGWVHFGVSKQYAKDQSRRFVSWHERQPTDVQECYGKTTLKDLYITYLTCQLCQNSWRNFRPFEERDCPIGCTFGPIVYKEEK